MNRLKEKLLSGQTPLGTHVSLGDSVITEMLGLLGFDYVWIDTEHTPLGLDGVEKHMIAARAAGVSPIVRVPENHPVRLKPVLEMGPDAVVIPQVNSCREVIEAVRNCGYPPQGVRGWGPRYAARYGTVPTSAYLRDVRENTLCFVQVENVNAVEELPESARVEGVDAFIIGPCDLASSIGHIGDWNHPEAVRLIERAIETAHRNGKWIGVSYGMLSEEEIAVWKRRGVDFISLGSDVDYIVSGGRLMLEKMKKAWCD